MKKSSLAIILLTSIMTVGMSQTDPRNYFLDAAGGNDESEGSTPLTAWKSIDKVNGTTFNPGDSILLKSGEVWNGRWLLKGSGAKDKPIVLTSYGEGEKPVIHGTGLLYTIFIYNREYWEINNLEITNFNPAEETLDMEAWEANNKSYWAESTTPRSQYNGARTRKCAILVEAKDYGAINHLHFRNLEIHGVNGDITSKDNGGIFLEIKSGSVETWFDDLLFEGCHIYDVDRTGISNKSYWDDRSLDQNSNWIPSKNVRYLNNIFERTGGNALIVRVTDGALMQGNLFAYCSIKWTGNANFPFNCDNMLIQYNEAHHTKYNLEDNDAGGFDSDYRCKNTIIQYNYSHDNEYGGILITSKGGGDRFNDGTIIRYNLFEDNHRHVVRVSGKPTNTVLHNNVFFVGAGNTSNEIIWHKSWSGYPDGTSYYNNIFYNLGSGNAYDLGSSTNNTFEHNLFYGNPVSNEPDDPHKISENPGFANPGTDGAAGFKITGSSPAAAAGKVLAILPDKDYFGNELSSAGPIDLGIHQVSEPLSDRGFLLNGTGTMDAISLFPNPAHEKLSVDCTGLPVKAFEWRITDIRGRNSQLCGSVDKDQEDYTLEIRLDKAGLQPGIYFLNFSLENGKEMLRPFVYY